MNFDVQLPRAVEKQLNAWQISNAFREKIIAQILDDLRTRRDGDWHGVAIAPLRYAWEPVIFRGGRKRPRSKPTVRDWVSACITLQKGCPGAKPEGFSMWLFDLLNMEPQDDLVDMFPGSGSVAKAWNRFRGSPLLPLDYSEGV